MAMMQHVTKAGSAADLAEAPNPTSVLSHPTTLLDHAYGHEHVDSVA
jgi:ferritin